MFYWNCCLIRTWCLVATEENSAFFWSNLRLILLIRQFGGVNTSKANQMCPIMVYGNNYLRRHWQQSFFFKKKHEKGRSYYDNGISDGKHGNHTMSMAWFMTTMPGNMTAMPSSWHDHNHKPDGKPNFKWYTYRKSWTYLPKQSIGLKG